MTAALGADGAASRLRQVLLPAAEDDVDGAATARLAAELAAWLGRGSPLPPADPAVAAYFVTIPGAGKSAITKWLEQPEERAALEGAGKVTVKVRAGGFGVWGGDGGGGGGEVVGMRRAGCKHVWVGVCRWQGAGALNAGVLVILLVSRRAVPRTPTSPDSSPPPDGYGGR